jgi:HEAT repeat protein
VIGRSAIVLSVVVIAIFAGGRGSALSQDRPPGPVFFEEPDRLTMQTLTSALEDLRGNSITDHTRGRESLEEIGYWAVPPLLMLLKTGSSIEKRNAALALGIIGPGLAGSRGLEELLKVARTDRHQYAPVFCSLSVGRYCDPSSVSRLHAMIIDPSRDERRVACILSVAKIRDPKSFDVIHALARSNPGDRVKRTALLTLGFFRDRSLLVENGLHRPLPVLVKALRSTNERHRRAALLAIALLGHRDLRPLYDRAARSRLEGDSEVRKVALLILARFADPDVTKLLLTTLADPRAPAKVKVMAALILVDRKDPAALDRLLKLNPRETDLKSAVTLALSNFETPEALNVIVRRLLDKKDQVRAAAAIALSRFTNPEHKEIAIARLTTALRQGGALDRDVRYDFQLARRILQTGDADGDFLYLGNREFVLDMGKDAEERLLDFVNLEMRDILGIEALTPLRAGPIKDRFRVDDSTAELRDLKEHLDRHPYFVPEDIPPPNLTATPLKVEPVGPDKPDAGEQAENK